MHHNANIYFSEKVKKVNSKHFMFPPFKINTTFADHIYSLTPGSFRLHVIKEAFDLFWKVNQINTRS